MSKLNKPDVAKMSAATEAAARKNKAKKSKGAFRLYVALSVALIPIIAAAIFAISGSSKSKKTGQQKSPEATKTMSTPMGSQGNIDSGPPTDRGPDATFAPIMEAFDIDKDGKISFEEMDLAGKSAEERHSEKVRGYQDAMKQADFDKDAHLSREEIVKFINDLTMAKMATKFGQEVGGAGIPASYDALARILLEPEELRNPKPEDKNESETPEENREGMAPIESEAPDAER